MTSRARNGITIAAKNFDDLANTARIDLATLEAVTGKSRATIYRWVDRGILPTPVKLPGTHNAWIVGQVRAALGITPPTGG